MYTIKLLFGDSQGGAKAPPVIYIYRFVVLGVVPMWYMSVSGAGP